MNRTAEILYRPDGWSSKILLFHIEDVAERMGVSRREVDRMVDDGELTKVLWKGLSCIPAHQLQSYGLDMSHEEPTDTDSQRGQAPGRSSRSETETEPATPWEDLSYEPR